MADKTDQIVEPVTLTPEELARKVADQDRAVFKVGDLDTTDSITALDALATAKTKENADEAETAQKQADEDAVKVKSDEEAKKKAEEDAKSGKSVAASAPDPVKGAPAADALKSPLIDPFPDVQLPPGSRAKSSEAFASVKLRAAQEISALTQKTADLEKRLKEQEEKLKNPIPVELENELKELRSFRAKLDIEVDPKWKDFEARSGNTSEFIYAQLKRHGGVVDNDTIEQIKKLGGPLGVNMQKILDAINDPQTTRLVQAKLADLEQIRFDKEQAIQAAKSNTDAYLQARSKESEQAVTQHNDLTKTHYHELASKMDWLLPRAPKPEATEEDKKAIEAHNKWAADTKKELEVAFSDDSPQMRAILLAGMAQLFYLQRVHGNFKATSEKQISGLETKLKEANDTLERYKRASTTRIRDVPPSGGVPAARQETVNPNMSASESLDSIAKKVMEAREAAQQ
jgi:hypothetical protein